MEGELLAFHRGGPVERGGAVVFGFPEDHHGLARHLLVDGRPRAQAPELAEGPSPASRRIGPGQEDPLLDGPLRVHRHGEEEVVIGELVVGLVRVDLVVAVVARLAPHHRGGGVEGLPAGPARLHHGNGLQSLALESRAASVGGELGSEDVAGLPVVHHQVVGVQETGHPQIQPTASGGAGVEGQARTSQRAEGHGDPLASEPVVDDLVVPEDVVGVGPWLTIQHDAQHLVGGPEVGGFGAAIRHLGGFGEGGDPVRGQAGGQEVGIQVAHGPGVREPVRILEGGRRVVRASGEGEQARDDEQAPCVCEGVRWHGGGSGRGSVRGINAWASPPVPGRRWRWAGSG